MLSVVFTLLYSLSGAAAVRNVMNYAWRFNPKRSIDSLPDFCFQNKVTEKNNTNIIFKEQHIPKQTLLEIKNDYSKQLEWRRDV